MACSRQRPRERPGTDLAPEPPEGTSPTNTLTADFWLQVGRRYVSVVLSPPVCGAPMAAWEPRTFPTAWRPRPSSAVEAWGQCHPGLAHPLATLTSRTTATSSRPLSGTVAVQCFVSRARGF